MQVQSAPPAPSTPAVSSTPTSVQMPDAKAAPIPPAVPAHAAQAEPSEQPPVPSSPAAKVASPKTAPPAAPATTPTGVDPAKDVTANTTLDHTTPTHAPIDTEAEENLSAEINKLWAEQKDGKAFVRRTRAELKTLRLELGAKLSSLKAILARTGRGGGWASYLRTRKIPLASADKYVAEHAASLTRPEEKLLTEELSEVEQVREAAKKLLPRLTRLLVTQELVYEFIHHILWNLDVAEVTDTDDGLEIPRTAQDDSDDVEDQAAESAVPAPVAG